MINDIIIYYLFIYLHSVIVQYIQSLIYYIPYSHLSNNRGGWNRRGGEAKIALTKRGGWNKRGGWKIFMKSINVEGDFFVEGGIFQNR